MPTSSQLVSLVVSTFTNQRYHNLTRNIQHIVVIMFLTNLKFTVISDAILCQTISDQVWTIF